MSTTRPTPIKANLNRAINDAQHVMFNGALKVLESITRYEDMYNGMLAYPDFCDDAMNKLASLHFRSARYQQVFIDVYGITAAQAIRTDPPCYKNDHDRLNKEFCELGIPYTIIVSKEFVLIDGEKEYKYTFKRLSDEALKLWEGLIND